MIARVNALLSEQPHHMTFTDRHSRLIGDIESPGVDSSKEEDAHFPGLELVIEDYIEIPEVDLEGPDARYPQIFERHDTDIPQDDPTPTQVAPTQEVSAPQTSSPVAKPHRHQALEDP
jgi:hypothetical protein